MRGSYGSHASTALGSPLDISQRRPQNIPLVQYVRDQTGTETPVYGTHYHQHIHLAYTYSSRGGSGTIPGSTWSLSGCVHTRLRQQRISRATVDIIPLNLRPS